MHKQKGMTSFGTLFTVIIVVMLGILVMRIVPVYIENYMLGSSIRSLQDIPANDFAEDLSSNIEILKSKLLNRVNMNGLDPAILDKIKITPKDARIFQISVKYTVVKHLVYNINLLFDFDELREVTIAKD
jgi:Domain of unknown function (DUF4845)